MIRSVLPKFVRRVYTTTVARTVALQYPRVPVWLRTREANSLRYLGVSPFRWCSSSSYQDTTATISRETRPHQHKPDTQHTNAPEPEAQTQQNHQAIGVLHKRVMMIFTCMVCNTRSAKTFTRHSYEKGIVIARCHGCDNHHLIADNLGWFGLGDRVNIENILNKLGRHYKNYTQSNPDKDAAIELTVEDYKLVVELQQSYQQAKDSPQHKASEAS